MIVGESPSKTRESFAMWAGTSGPPPIKEGAIQEKKTQAYYVRSVPLNLENLSQCSGGVMLRERP